MLPITYYLLLTTNYQVQTTVDIGAHWGSNFGHWWSQRVNTTFQLAKRFPAFESYSPMFAQLQPNFEKLDPLNFSTFSTLANFQKQDTPQLFFGVIPTFENWISQTFRFFVAFIFSNHSEFFFLLGEGAATPLPNPCASWQ